MVELLAMAGAAALGCGAVRTWRGWASMIERDIRAMMVQGDDGVWRLLTGESLMVHFFWLRFNERMRGIERAAWMAWVWGKGRR